MADRRITGALLLALAVVALLATAPAAFAVKTPGLASTAQYKAFIEYVKKMEERSSQPTSSDTKNKFEAKLTAKKTAAAHKANALFNRASDEAKAEANETAQEQVEGVRAKEGKALETLKSEANGKLERLEAEFQTKLERMETGHRNREGALKEQIRGLRGQKSQAKPGTPKEKIQEHIEAVQAQIAANHEDEKERRQDLKNAVEKKRLPIEEAAKEEEVAIGEKAEKVVKKIQNHWAKAYEEKRAALNTTRENRLGYLGSKLEQGRAAIAAMPSTG
ncbi:MAG: hypothetical protein ACRDPE_11865 [Solirubrobacterales bacterium]